MLPKGDASAAPVKGMLGVPVFGSLGFRGSEFRVLSSGLWVLALGLLVFEFWGLLSFGFRRFNRCGAHGAMVTIISAYAVSNGPNNTSPSLCNPKPSALSPQP